MPASAAMTFVRLGRSHQLRIADDAELAHVLELDEAHWVALSAPVDAFRCEPELMRHLNRDGDGRLKVDELRAGIAWLRAVLARRQGVSEGRDVLSLSDLDPTHPEAETIRAAARELLGPGEERVTRAALKEALAPYAPLKPACPHAKPAEGTAPAPASGEGAPGAEGAAAKPPAPEGLRLLERAVLYQRDLLRIANNFVSFPELYNEEQRALFERGTLIMDSRRFGLAVPVRDREAHAKIADGGRTFVLYVELVPRGGGDTEMVAVPVTWGGRGNLDVGKRGLFIDCEGVHWDATVVSLLEHHISLSEAFRSPFRAFAQAIIGRIESLQAQAGKRLETQAQATIADGQAGKETKPKGKPEPKSESAGLTAGGLVAGGGIALAALTSSLAFVTKTVTEMGRWQVLAGIVGAILAVVVPSLILALVRLWRRDLSNLLEGSGWAINDRMRLTRTMARHFTRTPPYPAGARGTPSALGAWTIALSVVLVVLVLALLFSLG